ncbi:GPP34 family phosphoprotein [Streptomyces sp. NPDC051569]|uniref:GOLPH3/VPS74 family protein n=1 Tax=Streptomyces sp. NPDC051569 TaxID=3365661 RepID=UPI0037A49417
METTLGEELLLLSLDDKSGAGKESTKTASAIAAASLVELALAGRIEVTGDLVIVRDPAPVGVECLDAALAAVVARDKPRKVADWMYQLKREAVAGATQGLQAKGLIREETKKVLGLFPVRRYPEADGSVEAAVRRRLDAAVLQGETPDERTACLVALLHGAKLHRLAFPATGARAVEKRMAAIARGQWAAPAVRRVVDAAEAALTVIITSAATSAVIAGG